MRLRLSQIQAAVQAGRAAPVSRAIGLDTNIKSR
jgi:hypothetical protein